MRVLSAALVLALAGCMTPDSRAAGVVVSPAQDAQSGWSEQEKQANVVMRNLRETPEASFHLLRVRSELPMRKHAQSDLVLMVVAGQVEVHLGTRAVPSSSGDVIEVPRDVPYGVVNKGRSAGVLYLVYTPQLGEDDVRLVRDQAGESAWKWNLWTQ